MKLELFNKLPKEIIIEISKYLKNLIAYRIDRFMFKIDKHDIRKQRLSLIPKPNYIGAEFLENKYPMIFIECIINDMYTFIFKKKYNPTNKITYIEYTKVVCRKYYMLNRHNFIFEDINRLQIINRYEIDENGKIKMTDGHSIKTKPLPAYNPEFDD